MAGHGCHPFIFSSSVIRFFFITICPLSSRRIRKERTRIRPNLQTLFAFLDHLPSDDGLWNVCGDIIKARHDLNGLRDLADHYVSNILIPSMFSPVF
jgi:hypothetical protein